MRRVVLALLLVAACKSGGAGDDDGGGGDDGHDANPDDLASLTCEELRERYAAELAALDKTCAVDGDCTSVNGSDTCDCVPHLSTDCGGDPVQRAAWEAASDTLDPIGAEYAARCTDCYEVTCTCDCPPRAARCGDLGLCTSAPQDSCFPDLDAGP